MHNLLTKLLQKRDINNIQELNPEEADVFTKWDSILSTDKEVTVSSIREFCERMVSAIETKWLDLELSREKKGELVPYHSVYKALLGLINGERVERERLEKYLQQLIEQ